MEHPQFRTYMDGWMDGLLDAVFGERRMTKGFQCPHWTDLNSGDFCCILGDKLFSDNVGSEDNLKENIQDKTYWVSIAKLLRAINMKEFS